ncbi:MAG: lytic murein transglycosylase B [Gammaproteobacteria bacterium PRO9]|nr:lytic murein transglycosylase B [Gammaproteobacteria bacterium PRO9]
MIPTSHGRRRAAAGFVARTLICSTALLAAGPAFPLDLDRADVQAFMSELVQKDAFEAPYVRKVLSGVEPRQSILDAISRPAEKVKPWFEYRAIFLTPRRISAGVDFYRAHEARLRKIAASSGVPAEIITAILGVETFYGTRTGSFPAIDALSTLAFDYPPRGDFFRRELRNLFLLAREEQLDISKINGSYAGALGPPQFIPSSYLNFGVDGDGDGRRDLLTNWDDIAASVANYFREHNWQAGQPVATQAQLASGAKAPADTGELVLKDTVASLARQGVQFTTDLPDTAPAMLVKMEGEAGPEYWVGFQNYFTITKYNRSTMYALAVYQLSEAIAAAAGLRGDNVPVANAP